ncbi:hypothetical protein GOBAR_DD07978 [Gossypium barbadense]|nr:hypothetical protein GOBAR_DD07978 [Gossypium barbadense]
MRLKQEDIFLNNNTNNLYVSEIPVDKQKLAAPIKSVVDKFQILPEFLKVRGLVKQHLDSFNYFVNTGIKKVVSANDRIVSHIDPSIYLRFNDVRIGNPSMTTYEKINPHTCRLADMTYAAPIFVDIEYMQESHGQRTRLEKKNVVIGRMPIMLRSCRCVLYGKDEAELARLGECPLDPGGYFIINGAEKIPIMVVMKAMGMESDQEVIQMVGADPCYSALLLPSIEECARIDIYTQEQALAYLDTKELGAFLILRDIFLANVPVRCNNFRPKCLYVAVMLRRMLEATLNKHAMDDKDYVGNKHLELSGQLISLLFEDLFKQTIKKVGENIDKALAAISRSRALDPSRDEQNPVMDLLFQLGTLLCELDIISKGLQWTLSTGNLRINRFRMQSKGVTQILGRMSFIGTLGFMTKVSQQFDKSRKVSGPRALHPSQWGMLCPCDTPEGEGCGLTKNLALTTHVTTDEDEGPLISLCYCLGVEDMELLSGEELHTPNSFLVMLNGLILGKHRRPQTLGQMVFLFDARFKAILPKEGKRKKNEDGAKKFISHFANALRKLRRAGKIGEFVSVFVNEKQRCVYISSDGGRVCRPLVIVDKGISRIKEHHMKELLDGVRTFNDFLGDGLVEYLDVNEENNALIALYEGEVTPETTHIEIEPFTILGVNAGLIPYPHHNQSPRNTYQVGYDKLGAGQNATVAVMSCSGYDIEDAIVMNKASLDRGFGRCIVMKKYSNIIQKSRTGASDSILRPQRTGPDDDGIAAPGEIIRPNDILLNKVSIHTRGIPISSEPLLDSACRPAKQLYKGPEGESCVLDRVALSSDQNGNLSIKFLIRHTRRPELGDKFSSRHGQKGVCGIIIQQEDLPFSERGICPDLIMNPHGFPSRMTVGKMVELLGGKAGVSCGRFHYGSAFGEPSGHADKVLDKMHARGNGPRVMLTRQPTEGRTRKGGLRVGEMERDCLIAYGASMLIYERMMLSSDPYDVQVCRKCGLIGYYSHKLKIGFCPSCKIGENVSSMKLPYACKLLIQELQSMNIVPRLKLVEP